MAKVLKKCFFSDVYGHYIYLYIYIWIFLIVLSAAFHCNFRLFPLSLVVFPLKIFQHRCLRNLDKNWVKLWTFDSYGSKRDILATEGSSAASTVRTVKLDFGSTFAWS